MSKYLLRLIVVILLIVVVTVVVWLILNRPDESKKIYDEYISLIDDEGYQNYEYFTKEFTDPVTQTSSTLLNFNTNINSHYRVTNAIKEDIELNLMLLNYVTSYDEVAQDGVLDAIANYNSVAYGADGVAYQARYLYEYYVAGNYNQANVEALINKLLVTMHNMEVAGANVLTVLKPYVQTYVYAGNQPEDIKYVLYDTRALVASSVANSYENTDDTDKLYQFFNNYNAYMTKLETLISTGEENGYNTLVNTSTTKFIDSYNALETETLIGLFNALNKTTYINSQTDENIKTHLTNIVTYLEATNE